MTPKTKGSVSQGTFRFVFVGFHTHVSVKGLAFYLSRQIKTVSHNLLFLKRGNNLLAKLRMEFGMQKSWSLTTDGNIFFNVAAPVIYGEKSLPAKRMLLVELCFITNNTGRLTLNSGICALVGIRTTAVVPAASVPSSFTSI